MSRCRKKDSALESRHRGVVGVGLNTLCAHSSRDFHYGTSRAIGKAVSISSQRGVCKNDAFYLLPEAHSRIVVVDRKGPACESVFAPRLIRSYSTTSGNAHVPPRQNETHRMSNSPERRVLCVDDDPHVLAVLTDTFTGAGYEVDTAIDGGHALQQLATTESPYDVLVVDERMPVIGGWRFVVQARAADYKGKVIVFSGYIDDTQRKRFQDVSVNAIVTKPVRPTELLRVVSELTASA